MTYGHGFYKDAGDGLNVLFAPIAVTGPGISLVAANAIQPTTSTNGWMWYLGEDAARKAFGLPLSAAAVLAVQILAFAPSVTATGAAAAGSAIIAVVPTAIPGPTAVATP